MSTKSKNMYLEIAVFTPLRHTFTYTHSQFVAAGCRVIVPFAKRHLIGVVISCQQENTSQLAENKLKSIKTVIDSTPIFDEFMQHFLCWSSHYYLHPIGDVFESALPVKLRSHQLAHTPDTLKSVIIRHDQKLEVDKLLNRAPKQFEIYNHILSSGGSLLLNRLKQEFTNSSSAISSLITKKLVSIDEYQPSDFQVADSPFSLNREQQDAVNTVLSSQGFMTFLLQGITGSGKTEVYLDLSADILKNNQQVLILVPEISLSPQLIRRFTKRFGDTVCVSHSGLNNSDRYESWWRAKQGHAKIILGTRSAIFLPTEKLGLIIIDEEHDASYKQHDGFRYHARDLAIKRASLEKIPIVLGSATPSLETKYNALQGKYRALYLSKRYANATLPKIELIDTKKFRLFDGLSMPLIESIRQRIRQGEQTILFINRRGFAPVAQCSDCGWQAHCKRCDSFLTYHQNHQLLRCHHCNARHPAPACCPNCQSDLIFVGIGTQRIEQSIQNHLPDARLLRLDRDNITTQKKLDDALNAIHEQKIDVIIGTQLVVKGHDFPCVTLVGVINPDQGLYSVDFRATEHLFQQLVQVAGRAGRSERSGHVMIQTAHPENEDLYYIVQQDYDTFAQHCLAQRALLGFPPETFAALFRAEAPQQQTALNFLQQIKHFAQQTIESSSATNITIFDAIEAPAKKRIGYYRAQLFLTATHRKHIHVLIQQIIQFIANSKTGKKVRWSIDIDPTDMY